MEPVLTVVDIEAEESIARLDETYQAWERVRQLERLNATLAAQVDRQAKVVDAARRITTNGMSTQLYLQLQKSIDDYDAAIGQLVKDDK